MSYIFNMKLAKKNLSSSDEFYCASSLATLDAAIEALEGFDVQLGIHDEITQLRNKLVQEDLVFQDDAKRCLFLQRFAEDEREAVTFSLV